MNAQRWIALGMVVLAVACIASSNVWMGAILRDRGENPTPTPSPEPAMAEGDATPDDIVGARAALSPTAEATLDPVIMELLEEAQAELGVGDEPFVIMAGDFVAIDAMHRGEGTASVYKIGELQYVLRLDPFNVTSGPDLHVYLSEHEAPRTSAEVVRPSYVDLGLLKSTTGAQNYDIPDGVIIENYHSVVIYSRSFNIIFSTATLEPVRGQ